MHLFPSIHVLVLAGALSSPCVAKDLLSLKLLNYLTLSKSGSQTINGMQNDHNYEPSASSEKLFEMTHRWPGLHGADFLFTQEEIDARPAMINETIFQWNQGSLISMMWHACNPRHIEAFSWQWGPNSVISQLSDNEWEQLFTKGEKLNDNLYAMFHTIAGHLETLKKHGVEVLFRPFHEMNQGLFWWGGRPFTDGSQRLYREIHNYMTNNRSLDNIVWVWDLQDFDGLEDHLGDYDPGSDYWDVLCLDVYDNFNGFTDDNYEAVAAHAANASKNKGLPKPIAIGELQLLPSKEILDAQPLWTFFMAWSDFAMDFYLNTPKKFETLYQQTLSQSSIQGWQSWFS